MHSFIEGFFFYAHTTLDFHQLFFFSNVDYSELTRQDIKKGYIVFLLKAMVAYDELGSLVPIKRTLQVIDYQNQANKESEVSSTKRTRWWWDHPGGYFHFF